jgi:hypothetical protein
MQELTGQPNPQEAIRLLGEWTRGRFDIWMLAGSHNAGNRAILLSQLTGVRQPQSKSGVNALRAAYNAALQIEGETINQRERNFIAACRQQLQSSK